MSKPSLARGQRLKLIVAVAVLVVCGGWLIYFAATSLRGPGPAKPLDTPGWRVANDLNVKLMSRDEFHDTGAAVISEDPLRLEISGLVRSQRDLDGLREYLREIRPENDYDVVVEVLRRR